jgi:hypothetical protein
MALDYEPFPPGTDPDLLAGLNSVVQVEIDLGATGTNAYAHGATRADYRPVDGLGAIPCHISGWKKAGSTSVDLTSGLHPGVEATHTILYVHPLDLDRRYRLILLDPATLEPVVPPYVLNVMGDPDDEHRAHHHRVVRARREVL